MIRYAGNPFLQFPSAGGGKLLDTYTGSTVAYSVRLLRSAYSGALVRIRRSSDNAEKDFYPDSNDKLTMSSEDGSGTSLSTWIGSDSGYIRTWYDQSGNGNDAARVIAADQPRIVNAGTIDTDPDNGETAIFFDGTNDNLDLSSNINLTQNYFEAFVFNRPSTGLLSFGLAYSGGVPPSPFIWFTNNTIYSTTTATVAHDASQTQTGDFLAISLRDGSNNVKMWLNGTSKTTQTNSGNVGFMNKIGFYSGGYHDNRMQELVYWNSDQETNRSGIETNINTHFSIW